MTAKTNDANCTSGTCPVDNKSQDKLVKVTDLPLLGNPYPPKDVIQDDSPSSLELGVRSMRTTMQPYVVPFSKAYQKTSDILSIGSAHTRSTFQRLAENQSSVLNALVISGAGLLGVTLAMRKGPFKKILYGSVFFGGALAACYPEEVKAKGELAWFIVKNKLPALMAQQYEKLSVNKSPVADDAEMTSQSKKAN